MTNILVVEDDPSVLDNIVDTLEAEGFSVRGAENGRVALNEIHDFRPNLVICDILMPDIDGFALLDKFSRDPSLAIIPFVFLTALAERETRRKGMELGADDYLTKPFSSAELLAAVKARLKKVDIIHEKHQSELEQLRRNIIYALPHEMRTPLAFILGYAEMLEYEYCTAKREVIGQWAKLITKSGKRLHRVLENYLVYAQLDLAEGDPRFAAALRSHMTDNVPAIVKETAEQIAAEAGREADLELITTPIILRLAGDDLRKIIRELVDNAFKFSETGTKVKLEITRADPYCVISLRDHGRGMTAEQIQQLGAYMQFKRRLYEQQGLGLGFAIAMRLVKFHGGHLKVTSNPDEGTLIRIEFSAP
jgi:two-component system sensor histidine kinase/response regulator